MQISKNRLKRLKPEYRRLVDAIMLVKPEAAVWLINNSTSQAVCRNDAGCLACAVHFEHTPQGVDYWSDVMTRLGNLGYHHACSL
jgi:hypothetical protein